MKTSSAGNGTSKAQLSQEKEQCSNYQ